MGFEMALIPGSRRRGYVARIGLEGLSEMAWTCWLVRVPVRGSSRRRRWVGWGLGLARPGGCGSGGYGSGFSGWGIDWSPLAEARGVLISAWEPADCMGGALSPGRLRVQGQGHVVGPVPEHSPDFLFLFGGGCAGRVSLRGYDHLGRFSVGSSDASLQVLNCLFVPGLMFPSHRPPTAL